ncbi:MAG TPA: hypothetical protein VF530_03590 [Planctomycetota bacterium]
MSEDSNPRPDATPARGGEIRSNTPPAKLVQGDPPRREFGDRTDASRKGHPSSLDGEEREPEAHQYGDRIDESDVRHQGPHMEPTQSSGKDQRPGSTKQDLQKKPDARSGQGQQPARKGSEAARDAKPKNHDVKPNRPQGGSSGGM